MTNCGGGKKFHHNHHHLFVRFCWRLTFYITSHLSLWSNLGRRRRSSSRRWWGSSLSSSLSSALSSSLSSSLSCTCYLLLLSFVFLLHCEWRTQVAKAQSCVCWYHIILICLVHKTWPSKRKTRICQTKQCTKLPLIWSRTIQIEFCISSFQFIKCQLKYFIKRILSTQKGVFDLLTWKYARTQHCHLTICRQVGLSSWWSFGPAYLARLRTFSRPSQCLSEAYLVVYNIDIRYS